MKTIAQQINERMLAEYQEIKAVSDVYKRETGIDIPNRPFPAVITGYAEPLPGQRTREYANAPLKASLPPCTDPTGLDLCFDDSQLGTQDQYGLYAPQQLPCGISPIRYRWRCDELNLTSEACGWRPDPQTAGAYIPWRQAFYAVNTAHGGANGPVQTRDMDFLPIQPGLLVIMGFGDIGAVTGGIPRYGFFFHHMTDAVGIRACHVTSLGGGQQNWCCHYTDIMGQNPGCTIIIAPDATSALNQCKALYPLVSGVDLVSPTNPCVC